jgi:hypothetical protein
VFASEEPQGTATTATAVKKSQQAETIAAPQPYNRSVWTTLPTVSRDSQEIEAALIEFDISGKSEKPAWKFFVNPKSLQIQDKAVFTEVTTQAARVTHRHYSHSTGAKLSIQDLRFAGWLWGKSVKPSLDGLQELLRCRPDKNEFSPKLLLFVMGRRRFGPCVLEEVQWEESQWLGGDAAGIKLSLTLVEVPKPLTPAEKEERERQRQLALADMRASQGKPPLELTPRQQEEVTKAAKAYLAANKDQFSDTVQALIQKGNYKLKVDAATGAVTMTDDKGTAIGTVLTYDGKTLTAGTPTTTVPLKPGGKLSTTVPYKISETSSAPSSGKNEGMGEGMGEGMAPTTTPPPPRPATNGATASTSQKEAGKPFWVVLTGGQVSQDEMVVKTIFEMDTKLTAAFRLGRIVSVSLPEQDIDSRAIGYPRTGWFSMSYWDDQRVPDNTIKVEVIPG